MVISMHHDSVITKFSSKYSIKKMFVILAAAKL